MTLVIMAAGMGSRFGGLKQIEPVGPNGEFIIDYSIYDAIKAGFTKVIFIIKEENYEIFKETIGKRIENKIEVDYVFQNNDNVPNEFIIPSDRVKPLGTAHAVLCAKDKVFEPFVIINADDFYGRDGYIKAKEFIEKNNDINNYGLIAYKVCNTLTVNGSVKRGICDVNVGNLISLTESSCIETESGILISPVNGDESYYTIPETLVSMNLFVFYPSIFKYLENDFIDFLTNTNDLSKDEFFLPNVVCNHIKSNDIKCEVVENDAVWKGVTYKEDLEDLKQYIKKEINNGKYPVNLYK